MIRDLGGQAYGALRHNKRRSFLTMLGMAWGIATVVLLLAYGAGFERGVWTAFRSFGTNLVFVFPGRTSLQAGGTKAGNEIRLTLNDLDYIRNEVPLLKRLSPEVFKQCTVLYGTRSASFGVSGVYAIYPRMRRMEFAEGSPFNEADDFTHSRDALATAHLPGWPAPASPKLAQSVARYVVVDMFAKAASGAKTPEVIKTAEAQLKGIYQA